MCVGRAPKRPVLTLKQAETSTLIQTGVDSEHKTWVVTAGRSMKRIHVHVETDQARGLEGALDAWHSEAAWLGAGVRSHSFVTSSFYAVDCEPHRGSPVSIAGLASLHLQDGSSVAYCTSLGDVYWQQLDQDHGPGGKSRRGLARGAFPCGVSKQRARFGEKAPLPSTAFWQYHDYSSIRTHDVLEVDPRSLVQAAVRIGPFGKRLTPPPSPKEPPPTAPPAENVLMDALRSFLAGGPRTLFDIDEHLRQISGDPAGSYRDLVEQLRDEGKARMTRIPTTPTRSRPWLSRISVQDRRVKRDEGASESKGEPLCECDALNGDGALCGASRCTNTHGWIVTVGEDPLSGDREPQAPYANFEVPHQNFPGLHQDLIRHLRMQWHPPPDVDEAVDDD
jgi:hypothetical protein